MCVWGGGLMSERFLRSSRPGYPHPVSSELENSGIRVAVGDCNVTERTAFSVCDYGSRTAEPLGDVVTRTGIHTHITLWKLT